MESNKFKLRPVIVLSEAIGQYGITTVIPVSSKEVVESGDLVLHNWRNLGLKKLSVARIHRITSIAKIDLVEELGTLSDSDQKSVHSLVSEHLKR